MKSICNCSRASLLLFAFALPAQAQIFVSTPGDIPQSAPGNNSTTENVDFGDVDNDGDWDAVFADGGDLNLDQNRVWINLGPGAGLGTFQDETAARFPQVNDQSRDIEFVDFDGDSDLDIYIANTSSMAAVANRWWRNVGGGFYADETATRWVGLGGPGSSVGAFQILASGGFIDYTGDGDFADLDNDGDMDLFHSSYGGAFSGQTPSRIFLNDGTGRFTEFNPSGFQLSTTNLVDGDPGLWCEGIQNASTMNSNGTFCDIATAALDVDLMDVDGDFDIDVLLGDRDNDPRLFQNRLEENNGTLGFRDVTGSSFAPGYVSGMGHYEQEMGDLDGDGDVDILGVNWISGPGFQESTLRNNGSGFFSNPVTLADSNWDDEEGDFIDYDNDGDLDIYIANFSGEDRLYRNHLDGGANYSFSLVSPGLPAANGISRDADVCDVDGDGDYDVMVAITFGPNIYLQNTTDVPDTHAPSIPNLEQAPGRVAGSEPTVIRAHVYDNAPYYITWYNATELVYSVDGGGGQTVSIPMVSSGAQIFRAEIPGGIVGFVTYFVRSSDEYGNVGTSISRNYNAWPDVPVGTPFCFGDGTGANCPCNNPGAPGTGCTNSSGFGGQLLAYTSTSVAAGDLVLSATGLAPNRPGVFFEGVSLAGGLLGVPFGDGLRCAGGQLTRIEIRVASGAGTAETTVNVAQATGAQSGFTGYYQMLYRDPQGSPCGSDFNVTSAVQILWTP